MTRWQWIYHCITHEKPIPQNTSDDDIRRAVSEVNTDLECGMMRRSFAAKIRGTIARLTHQARCEELKDIFESYL